MHEIVDGKKIAHFIDFIDPDIVEKLEALEREKMLEAGGFYGQRGGHGACPLSLPACLIRTPQEEDKDERARIAHRPLAQDDESQPLEKRKRGSQMTTQRTKAGLDPAASDRAAVLSGRRQRDDENVYIEDGDANTEGSTARMHARQAPQDDFRRGRRHGNRAVAGMHDQGHGQGRQVADSRPVAAEYAREIVQPNQKCPSICLLRKTRRQRSLSVCFPIYPHVLFRLFYPRHYSRNA
ncbi:hypothetical protein DFH09DRAFT_1371521, partial [Mycena vulgaris]